ncbi:amidase [Saccharomonospora xinjiangensis]|uniref:Amidase, Asp-tRNAAsn/Glu-tRNAGln amidotransferase A subunit n=1 Tax=Saccharomonospora xinjiangensis XJ-54 TaxID=882086 RepID=I0UXW2_9PSEU|nr:amidase family protein [Saccharomonospora xinjiangensis]EID52715.1 amidase, Asp-tRNAAsn/Glu-tRNAGln amidotransferase A subunit [Saccharomonospora xinjiangensis XJ-54]
MRLGFAGFLALVSAVTAALSATVTPVGAGAAEPAPEVAGRTVSDLRAMLDDGAVTSVQLVEAYLRRIDAYDRDRDGRPGLRAVLTIDPSAVAQARRLDAERAQGHVRGPLHGIPVVVKDNIDTAGLPTTSGSLALRGLRPPDDATQVARLREAGAIVLAKTNLHEYAMSIYTTSSLGGQTRNPYDPGRHPGGSSGGTAAAVAASFAPAGLGTDTCGSVRIPAAHNNLVGVRPTLGLSSRDGVAPLAGTQDTVGPLTTSVEDAALLLDATVGYDPADPVTEAAVGAVPGSYTGALRRDALEGARLGIVTDYFGAEGREADTTALVRAAVADMEALGAEVVELGPRPELMDTADRANRVRHEFERDLNAYLAGSARGRPGRLAHLAEPRDELTLADIVASGEVTPSVLDTLRAWVNSPALPNPEYDEVLRRRDLLREMLSGLLAANDLDALVYPAISEPPTPIGVRQSYRNCRLAAFSGFPAVSVPAGFTSDGLPVGVELLGAPFSEPELLGYAYAYEQATGHRAPPEGTPPLG